MDLPFTVLCTRLYLMYCNKGGRSVFAVFIVQCAANCGLCCIDVSCGNSVRVLYAPARPICSVGYKLLLVLRYKCQV